MNKKLKEIIFYVISFIAIFILPYLLTHYFNVRNDETFYKWVNEDYETCMERAERDSRDTHWCGEVRNAAKLSYSKATQYSNNFFVLQMVLPLLFVLLFAIRNLRKEVEKLKEKIDV